MTFELPLPGARVVFSTRNGGVSEGRYESLNLGILTGDDPAHVGENRRRLAERLDVGPERVAMGWQAHGAELQEWSGPPASRFSDPDADLRKVDGHITDEPDLALLVLVADCLPVALAGGGRVAMLHCGWRGLAAGILERAVDRFDRPPAAVIGPGIESCCYEVGDEVLAAFKDLPGVADGRMLNLREVASRKLRAAGGREQQHVAGCTCCSAELYFSHRRDGPDTGRQAGLVWLTG